MKIFLHLFTTICEFDYKNVADALEKFEILVY